MATLSAYGIFFRKLFCTILLNTTFFINICLYNLFLIEDSQETYDTRIYFLIEMKIFFFCSQLYIEKDILF